MLLLYSVFSIIRERTIRIADYPLFSVESSTYLYNIVYKTYISLHYT